MKICRCGEEYDRGGRGKYCWNCYRKIKKEQSRIISLAYSFAIRRLLHGRLD